MKTFEVRIGDGGLSVRTQARDEVEALENADVAVGLRPGEDATVYEADRVPVGADGEDPE